MFDKSCIVPQMFSSWNINDIQIIDFQKISCGVIQRGSKICIYLTEGSSDIDIFINEKKSPRY